MKNKIMKHMLLLLTLVLLGSASIYADGSIPISGSDYEIVTDGIYQLELHYSGTITIGNTANNVSIIGSNWVENPHMNTQIVFEDSRTEPAIVTIENLNIIAKEGHNGIDFRNTGDGDNKLYISGNCKIIADANNQDEDDTYGAGIFVPEGTKLTIDKKMGLSDWGANLEAVGGYYGAGIGGGKVIYSYSGGTGSTCYDGGIIKIVGGKIKAIAGYYAAGIGGGGYGEGGTTEITGGVVTAIGGSLGAGIGGGFCSDGGSVQISGGDVTATAGREAAGIGSGCSGSSGGKIEISGGIVTATGGNVGAGIGGGYKGNGGTIDILDGDVTATAGRGAAGIGGGRLASGGTITIAGGNVIANGGYTGAGIGGGDDGSGETIKISDGQVTAKGGMFAAGIGGGSSGSGGTIHISGGEVTATAIYRGAGIGGGCWGAGGTIIIENNPSIFATKDEKGNDIGNGDTAPEQVTILQNESGANLKYIQIKIKDNVNQLIASNAVITIDDTTTYSDSDGKIGVFIIEGNSSYNYKIVTDEYFGRGTVTDVDDQNNRRDCVLVHRVKVDRALVTNITTYDSNDGTIIVVALDGYGTYEYSKDNGVSWQESHVFSGLSEGTYEIKARDSGDVSNKSKVKVVEITRPDRVAIIDVACQGKSYTTDDGVITIVNAQGGYGTYQYSKDDGTSWQDSHVFSGLSSGIYKMKTRDKQYPANVSEMMSVELTEPDIVAIIDVILQNVTTYRGNEGVITVSAIGGYGTYEYSKDSGVSWQDSNVFNLLIAGTYDIEVRDKKDEGNVDKRNAQEITEPERVAIIDVKCQDVTSRGGTDGIITVSQVQGGYGTYEYSIDNGASWSDNNVFNGLNTGTYEIIIRDKADIGNISEVKSVEVTEPEKIAIIKIQLQHVTTYGGTDGIITVSQVQGGYGTYEYSIDNGTSWSDNNVFNGLNTGTYEVITRDKVDIGNISEMKSEEITQPAKPYVPDYTPPYVEKKEAPIVMTKNNHKAGIKNMTTEEGHKKVTVKVDKQATETIIKTLKQGDSIDIEVKDKTDIVELEIKGKTVSSMQPIEANISIRTYQGTYILPSNAINIAALSKRLGETINTNYATVTVKISKPQAETMKIVQQATQENGLSIVVPPINFDIWVTYRGKQLKIENLSQMVTRLIPIPKGTDVQRITTCVIIDKDKTIRSVPTKLIQDDGQYYALIKSMTNSTYTIIQNDTMYTDIQGHWAEDNIQKMAKRLVVEGIDKKTTYKPDEDITRAELAEILVKAIGLKPQGTDQFIDVEKGSMIEKYIGVTYTYDIIKGTSKNTFAPNHKITREDTMTMIYRLARLIGYKGNTEKIDLNTYQDHAIISDYAIEAVNWNVSNDIIKGKTKTMLAPKQYITRGEIAAIIDRFLGQADLIE